MEPKMYQRIRTICNYYQLLLFLTCNVVTPTTADFIYTAISPKLIRPFSTYEIILSLERSEVPVNFEITISAENVTLAEQKLSLLPKASNLIKFDVLKVPAEIYNLTIDARIGDKAADEKTISETVQLKVDSKTMATLIQTDKPIYKPGEVVQIRGMVLDRLLKPVSAAGLFNVQILDPQRNIIKSWKGLEPRRKFGMIREKFELSKEPNLGEWTVEVSAADSEEKDKQSQTFSVEQYILPKFKVDIKAKPNFVTYNESKFNLEISSMYTHGKPVKGQCSVSLKPLYYYEVWNNQETKERKVSKSKDIDGQTSIEFDLKADLQIKAEDAREYGNEFQVEASCTEQVSGHIQNKSINIRLYNFPHKITVADQPDNYKPGFPLTMVLKVSTQDDIPISDPREDALKINHGFAYDAEAGIMSKSIPPTGLVTLTFDTPTNEFINVHGIEVSYKGHTQFISVPQKQTSPTKTYMILTLESKSHKAGDNVSISAKINKPFQSLTYILISRGTIVKWDKTFFSELKKEQQLSIPLPLNSPSEIKIIVFTVVTPQDAITVDSFKIDVKPVAEKNLKIKLSNSTVEPGTNISILCDGFPNSLIALRGVDQSVILLKEDKDINQESLTSLQQSFYDSMYLYGGWGGSVAYQTFEQAGLHILTNGLIKKNEHQPIMYGGYRRKKFGKSHKTLSLNSNSRLAYAAAPMMEMDMAMSDDSIAKASRGPISNSGSGNNDPPRIRKEFPETWIFMEQETTDGKLNLISTVPDTITSWMISGFQISTDEGIVLSDSSSKLTVFRPFFIALNLPYSVIKGEVLALQVMVHNYMEHEIKAQISIENSEGHFAFVEEDKVAAAKKEVLVNGSSVSVLSFMITPTKIGTVMLNLKAVSPMAGDAVSQPLIVKPPGVKQSKNNAILINLLTERNVSTHLSAVFPENRVPDADSLKVSVIGDPLGGTINNLDNLIQLPHGCGEQNMINFVPDIVVLDYLNATGSLTPEVQKKIIKYLEKGYQQELTYKRYDGSFSAFGNSDNQGSTWLTAFVTRAFVKAERHIFIDESVITSALEFLVLQQTEDGSFIEEGFILDQSLQGGDGKKSNRHALTAYVLLTFIEAKRSATAERVTNSSILSSGVNYLLKETSLGQTKDPYAINLITYLLHVLNHPKKDHYFKMMEEHAQVDIKSDFKFWKSPEVRKRPKHPRQHHIMDDFVLPYYSPWESNVKPASVEMTAYALLTYIIREGNNVKDSIPISRWLMKQRNEAGGFLSTQDTVVGITALAKFAKSTRTPMYQMAIKVTWGAEPSSAYTFYIGKDNMTTHQEFILPVSVQDVNVTAVGSGTAMAQLSWNYYTNNTRNSSAFELEVHTESKDNHRRVELSVCAAYTEPDKSNMVILEVNTPTGYSFDPEELLKIKSNPLIMRHESEDSDTRLNVYFSSLTSIKSCILLNAYRIHLVAKLSKASVLIYDYYDTTRRAQKFYDPPVIDICHICKLDDSCKMKNCI